MKKFLIVWPLLTLGMVVGIVAIVMAVAGILIGVEALLYWNPPIGGIILLVLMCAGAALCILHDQLD